jgi:hypothetical protein
MKKTILKIAVCVLLAAPVLSHGQDSNTNMVAPPAQPLPPPPVVAVPPAAEVSATTNAAPAKPKKMRTTPAVTGRVLDVDTNAMTLTVGKHTYELTSETRIFKGGKPAILSDISVGDKVGITYKKDRDIFDAATIIDSRKAEKSETSTNSVSGQN